MAVRDGTKLLLDAYRPSMPGQKFLALCSFSPYTRQLQRDSAPIGQNKAGISEFWVPRGYAHVIVDVRGSNGSEGGWDMQGPEEQKDLAGISEWVARQPWCDGNVGMMACFYFAMTQNLAVEQTLVYDSSSEQWIWGQPRWLYRSEPLDRPLEVTGPIQLDLVMASTAGDTDWIAILLDEAPDGSLRELTRGWLRSSHRAVAPARSRPNQPWHSHDRIDPLMPNKPEELQIEVISTCNLFSQGRGKSRLILPVIPR